MLTRRSNIILDHSVKVTSSDFSWSCFIDRFSSIVFSILYQSRIFPVAIQADSLYLTDQYWDLENSIETVIDYINENDGFTIVDWYTNTLINDQSIISGINNN